VVITKTHSGMINCQNACAITYTTLRAGVWLDVVARQAILSRMTTNSQKENDQAYS
jgi:hypothetical protein